MQSTDPFALPVATLSDGRSITLLDEIGRGRCGVVHRGLLEGSWGIRRPVAVKLIPLPEEIDEAEAIRQLHRVARRWACVRHPGLVQLFEVDRQEVGGRPTLLKVTDLVEGESLAALLHAWRQEGLRVAVDFAIVVALRVAEALGAALFTDGPEGSLTGLVHGDLSPRQILISSLGEVKLGDFGEAFFADAVSHVRSRARLAYTAPELAAGAPSTPRSDVFALGAILHEMLVGPRFQAGTTVAEANRLVWEGRFTTKLLGPNLPPSLRGVIEQATDPTPSVRHPHARALAFDLRREMLRLGLCDTQTCVRHAVVGWCEVRSNDGSRPVSSPDLAQALASND